MPPPSPTTALHPWGLEYTHWGVLGLPGALGGPVGHLGLSITLVWGVCGCGANRLFKWGGGLIVDQSLMYSC